MSRSVGFVLCLLTVVVVGCTPPTPASSVTLHIDVPQTGDVTHIPWLMAVDALREDGFTIEALEFSAVDSTSVVAMEQGELDFTSMSNQLAWSAVQKGAELATFIDMGAISFLLAAKSEIESCGQMDGRPMAMGSVSSVSTAMVNLFMEKNCPGARPELLVVRNVDSRLAALLSGEADAALIEAQELLRLEREKPGAYHALVDLADEYPGLQINSYVMRRGFAEQHPDVVKTFILAILEARRSLQDPQVLSQAIVRYSGVGPDEAQRLAEFFLERQTWDVSGEYTLETVQRTVDFLQEYGDLGPDIKAEDAADLSYLNEVWDEIGRQ